MTERGERGRERECKREERVGGESVGAREGGREGGRETGRQ